MSKVLVVTGTISPIEKSVSLEMVNRFLKYYKQKNPNDEITIMDLNKEKVGTVSLNSENQKDFWNEENALKYIKQLKSVDKLIISSPMQNFNVSALIKNYLDHILLANETFSYKYSAKGEAKGLLENLKVQILTTQGAPYGWYLFGNHTQYLWGVFDFVGSKVVEPILISGTKSSPYNKMEPKQVVDEFDARIKLAANEF